MESRPEPLFTAAQVRELDRIAIEEHGMAATELMERAGRAVYQAMCSRWPRVRHIAVFCGAGNNAGDGYVLARLARAGGLTVQVVAVYDPAGLKGAAREAWARAVAEGVPIEPLSGLHMERAELLVDALLGTGLQRPLEGVYREVVERMNGCGAPILAVDVPSGLDADTGAVLGAAVEAEATLTFIGRKIGLYTGEGPACAGQVLFDDLGVPAEVLARVPPAAGLLDDRGLAALLPRRRRTAHKGAFGHVLVVGGDEGMAGAARLAAEAAARAGAGLVSLATRAAQVPAIIAGRPEIMARGVESVADLAPLLARATVVAIGPGLGRTAWGRGMWQAVRGTGLPLVVDADALDLLAESGLPDGTERVLTPHPGEAARLLERTAAEIQADRPVAARSLQQRFGGVAVLKGAGTLVAGPDSLAVCSLGNPGMASGGMGDVLTGILAGLWAQGFDALTAAALAVQVHAAAADAAAAAGGERGLLASDLFPFLRTQLNP